MTVDTGDMLGGSDGQAMSGALPNPAVDPVLCHPFEEPSRHWELDARGRAKSGLHPIPGRRPSMMINPIPDDQKKPQTELDIADHRPNENINRIREKVGAWRDGGYRGATAVSVRLLEHWAEDHGRAQRPFFAQREAIETLIWLREVATRSTPERAELERESRCANDEIVRHAVKMATGTGKTVVMAMLIAWQTLNAARTTRRRNIQHGQRFVVLTPGLTIQRRLVVLKPSDPHNIYDEMYLVPKDLRPLLNRARVIICNYQSFQRQNLLTHNYSRGGKPLDSKAVKALMPHSADADQVEDYTRTVRRVLKPLLPDRMNRKTGYGDLVVINDEAHHCYLPGGRDIAARYKLRGGGVEDGTTDRSSTKSKRPTQEQKQSDACASVWFNVVRALRDIEAIGRVTDGHGQESVVYDFTATPFWIDTAQRSRPEQFGWVVSDFGLMDAIESGLTKLPRAPVSDDSPETETIWRRLFENTKPNHKLVKPSASEGAVLPQVFKGALDAQVTHWRKTLHEWGKERRIPPVLIIVADTTASADAIFEHIAGWPAVTENGDVRWTPGLYSELSNVDHDGKLHPRPRTMVIHSKIGQDDDLTAGARIHFKHLASRIVGRKDPKAQELADAVKEILNTVGKENQPGEQVRCVISVQMLSEGWDARNVTHIVGYRAFSTQLLCEQVTGRALRRSNYEHRREDGRYPPEHADIVGIPFEFMPSAGGTPKPVNPLPTTHVTTVPGRERHRILWPRVETYRRSVQPALLEFDSVRVTPWKPSPSSLPTSAELRALPPTESNRLIVPGQRPMTIEFTLASRVVAKLKEDGNASDHPLGFFPAALRASRAWLAHDVVTGPDQRHGLNDEGLESAVGRILDACTRPQPGPGGRYAVLERPLLDDTTEVDFETTLQLLHPTEFSEISHAACHSRLELSTARVLDAHDDVECWARNFRLGWVIPYMFNGVWRSYEPDFICRLRGGANLIIECKKALDAKAIAAARYVMDHWIPCVDGTADLPDGLRRWVYTMIFDSAETHGRITEIAAVGRAYRFEFPRISAAN